jgi:hypothetical protein
MKKSILPFVLSILVSGGALAQDWTQLSKIVASDREAVDLFGQSVNMSGDYAIVAARLQDYDVLGGNFQEDAGAAYIFEKDVNGNWQPAQKLVASDRFEMREFGDDTGISGNYAVVGCP